MPKVKQITVDQDIRIHVEAQGFAKEGTSVGLYMTRAWRTEKGRTVASVSRRLRPMDCSVRFQPYPPDNHSSQFVGGCSHIFCIGVRGFELVL